MHQLEVLLMDNNLAAAEETLAMIRKECGEASVFVGDVTNESSCAAAVDAATDRYGRLDTLVNIPKELVTKVVFDRGGYKYHGRVKALAEATRQAGLKF